MQNILARLEKHREESGPRVRAQTDLWWLATEVLGFDKLTESFHKPMLDQMDLMRTLRKIGKGSDDLWLWPREHYKTTIRKAQVIQDYLCDPTATVTWWHSVEEHAQEASVAISTALQKNKALRKLFPDGVLPNELAKRFIGSRGFRLKSNRSDDAPSFRAWGQTSEATGGHSRYGYLDDIIAANTIEDSAMPKVRSWYRNTVRNVILGSGWLNATGTRWDPDDIYNDWLTSRHWKVVVRAALEMDGKPDYKGKPVLFTVSEIRKKRDEMGEVAFAAQMMNDPSPAGEKPWVPAECEHIITADQGRGQGFVVVLSDPAPAKVGAFGTDKKREGGDSKDYWTNAVVKFRAVGDRREIVLLDGSGSQSWGVDEGFSETIRLARKWSANGIAVEKTGQAVAFYMETLRNIARREGVRYRPIDLSMTYKGKNVQFSALADRAKHDEFLICETCEPSFLDLFLSQARDWRPIMGGRNSLKYDDHANVVSFATDPVFKTYAPITGSDELAFDPFAGARGDRQRTEYGGRYIRF